MATELPLWYAVERGTDLTEFAPADTEEPGEQGGRDPISSSVFGTLIVGLIIAAAVAVMAASTLPLWAVVLTGLAAVAFVAWGLYSSWTVARSEEPPAAALFTVMVMAGVGEVVVMAFIVGMVVAGIVVLVSAISALGSGRR